MRRPRPFTWITVVTLVGLLAGCGFVNAGGNDEEVPAVPKPVTLTVISSGVHRRRRDPDEFTCKGSNTSPPLAWTGVPADARSVALVVEDPDAPNGSYIHWVVYNIDPAPVGDLGR